LVPFFGRKRKKSLEKGARIRNSVRQQRVKRAAGGEMRRGKKRELNSPKNSKAVSYQIYSLTQGRSAFCTEYSGVHSSSAADARSSSAQ
jgi:hypothetical protein